MMLKELNKFPLYIRIFLVVCVSLGIVTGAVLLPEAIRLYCELIVWIAEGKT